MDNVHLYAPIDKADDEQRMVYGYASTESLDSQNEIVKKSALQNALEDYMKYANIREMHQPSAVGKTKQANLDKKGLYIAVKVVDDKAWEKVKEGVYNGFSIGGRVLQQIDNEITDLKLSEISLVDRPANPDAVFDVWKMDGDQKEEIIEKKDIKKDVYGADYLIDLACSLSMFIESEKYEGEDSSKLEAALKNIKAAVVTELKEGEYFDDITVENIQYAEKTLNLSKKDEEVVEETVEEVVETEGEEATEEPEVQATEESVPSEDKVETEEVVETPVEEEKVEEATEEVVEEPVVEEKSEKAVFFKSIEDKIATGKMPDDEELTKMLELSDIDVNQKNIDILKYDLAGKIIDHITATMKETEENDAKKADLEAIQKETARPVATKNHQFDEVMVLINKLEDQLVKTTAADAPALPQSETQPESPAETTNPVLELLRQAVALLTQSGEGNQLTASEEEKLRNGVVAGSERTSKDNIKADIEVGTLEKMEDKIAELTEKLAKLESQPVPVKVVASYQTIEKGFVGNESSDDKKAELEKALKRADEIQELYKAGDTNPLLVKEANELTATIQRLQREI